MSQSYKKDFVIKKDIIVSHNKVCYFLFRLYHIYMIYMAPSIYLKLIVAFFKTKLFYRIVSFPLLKASFGNWS